MSLRPDLSNRFLSRVFSSPQSHRENHTERERESHRENRNYLSDLTETTFTFHPFSVKTHLRVHEPYNKPVQFFRSVIYCTSSPLGKKNLRKLKIKSGENSTINLYEESLKFHSHLLEDSF